MLASVSPTGPLLEFGCLTLPVGMRPSLTQVSQRRSQCSLDFTYALIGDIKIASLTHLPTYLSHQLFTHLYNHVPSYISTRRFSHQYHLDKLLFSTSSPRRHPLPVMPLHHAWQPHCAILDRRHSHHDVSQHFRHDCHVLSLPHPTSFQRKYWSRPVS